MEVKYGNSCFRKAHDESGMSLKLEEAGGNSRLYSDPCVPYDKTVNKISIFITVYDLNS